MSSRSGCWLIIGIVVTALGNAAFAQFSPAQPSAAPATEDTYLSLRESTDRTTQRFAERYFNLIKLQEWSSANGKSKIMAKYLAHDPDLKRVTLAAVKGSGKNRVVREITVEVTKLSKTCQSRVKQIATIQTKLDELAAAEESDATGALGEGAMLDDRGAPMIDERGVQPRSRYSGATTGEQAAPAEYEPTAAAPTADQGPVIDPNDPDPLGFAEIANEAPAGLPPQAGGGYSSRYSSTPPASLQPAGAAEGNQWATSYDSFRANFTVMQSERGEPAVDWGELRELSEMNDIITAANRGEGLDAQSRQQLAAVAQNIPEVNWTATFAGFQPNESGENEAQFAVLPLPEPLKVRFVVDKGQPVGTWAELQPRQPVQFVGRFDMERSGEIIVRIRMAGSGDASTPPRERGGR